MPQDAKTLPTVRGPKLKNLKRSEYFEIGQLIKTNSEVSGGFVSYTGGTTDESVAKQASVKLGAEISPAHVAKTRQALFGKLATESSSAKEQVAALTREVGGLRERIKRIEDYLSAEMKDHEENVRRLPAPQSQKSNGKHN